MKNYGVNIHKELAEQSPKDWKVGAILMPCITDIKESERTLYLPLGEVQRGKEDMQDCASRGPLNILEMKFNWLIFTRRLHEENHAWLERNGYVTSSGRVEFSDAFIAILSGTTREGNSLKAPLEAIRTCGLVPKKLLPFDPSMTFEEYHDPRRITPEIKALGLEFARRFPVNYGKVYREEFARKVKEDALDVAGYAWPDPIDGEYPRVEYDPNHCFIIFKRPEYFAFDNYLDEGRSGDFTKKLAFDYSFLGYGYQIIVRENVPEIIEKEHPNVWIGIFQRFLAGMKALLTFNKHA